MPDDFPDQFARSFQQFLERVNELAPAPEEGSPPVARRVCEFLGDPPERLAISKVVFPLRDLATVHLAAEALLAQPGWTAELAGYTVGHDMDFGLAKVLAPSAYDPVREGPPVYTGVSLPGRRLACLERGLYLISSPDGRVGLLQHVEHGYRTVQVRLEAVARSSTDSQRLLDRIGEFAAKLDVLRGSVISLGADEATDVSFHSVAAVTREELILPDDVLSAVERTSLGIAEHASLLRDSGRHLKRGLLLHGAPGTGKSLAVRYLIGQMPGRTVVVLTGREMALIKLSCDLARQLAPSTVVIEDVDLVAEDRTADSQCGPLLFELMNQMDGLPGDADILFLLTTNRPEALEPALASRPGRVDQAIEFPLPDAACRRRLFALYARGLDVSTVDIEEMVARTEGASAAFIKELLRRAALNAAIRIRAGGPIATCDDDFTEALREIVFSGGALTARLLGGRGLASPAA